MNTYRSVVRKPLFLAVAVGLSVGAAYADFPGVLELSSLNGTTGFALAGVSAGDHSGRSVSAAGDVNGDGIGDLIIGAPDADPNAPFAGASYVVFGKTQGFSSPLNLSTLNGSNGFVINGEAQFDGAGAAVSAAGDINGDGFDDLVIGAPDASPGASFAGSIYVVFGSDQAFSSPLELSTLNGANGFVINGVNEDDSAGTSVSGAGDVNGDGIDDLIIGAFNANAGAGVSYVVFGSDQGLPNPLDLSSLTGANGFAINGQQSGDSAGTSVSGAGDINGDGIADVIIGAPLAGPIGNNPGAAYVVFGSNQAWSSPFLLSSLDGSNGFIISGVTVGDELGNAVSAAGDINADGIGDLLIGAFKADPNGISAGASYVVFGSDQAWSSPFLLSSLDGSNGFAINGISAGDESGTSVQAAGKLNADAIDDLVIGAPFADPNGTSSGESYVLFGSTQAWAASIELSSLNGTGGFTINGVAADDRSGRSVSTAGDIDGDGRGDLLIGAPGDPNGNSTGFSYLIFGDTGLAGDLIFADSFE